MDTISSCAERILRQSFHPALRLSELVELVAEEIDRTLDIPRLRAVLKDHHDRFCILEPARSAWGREGPRRIPAAHPDDAWVVAVGGPDDPIGGPAAPALKLRESVRWLGRGIDVRSPTDVGRWQAIALAERAVRAAVEKRAA